MGKVKKLLTGLERIKGKIAKFLIVCASLKFFTSTLYRVYDRKDARTQMETMVNLYSLLLMGLIVLHEFVKCFLCRFLTENFKVISHYSGKGIVFILLSLIYMSHSLGAQQNYSAYLLFFSGVVLVLIDLKYDQEKPLSPYEMAMARSKNKKSVDCYAENSPDAAPETIPTDAYLSTTPRDCCKSDSIGAIEIPIQKGPCNPYDIPDDF